MDYLIELDTTLHFFFQLHLIFSEFSIELPVVFDFRNDSRSLI